MSFLIAILLSALWLEYLKYIKSELYLINLVLRIKTSASLLVGL